MINPNIPKEYTNQAAHVKTALEKLGIEIIEIKMGGMNSTFIVKILPPPEEVTLTEKIYERLWVKYEILFKEEA